MQATKHQFRIIIPVILFSIISILTIYSALTYTSHSLGNLALKQAFWYCIGWGLVFVLGKLKNEYLYQRTWALYIIGNLLLLGLLFFTDPIHGSRCWYVIPGIGSIQPSEFMKIFLMLTLATMIHHFQNDHENATAWEEFCFLWKTFLIVLIPSVLTFLQPDTGCVLMYLVIYLSMLFASGIRFRWFVIGGGILLFLIGGCLWLYFYHEPLFIQIFGTSLYYRIERIFNWQSGSGLQLENALTAIGSAGVFGHGYNQTPVYFPESSTDFIFAVYASNFGFLGILFLLALLIYFDIQIILLAKKKIEDTNHYILAGCIGMLLFQQVENIGMTIGLLPITGITLPFISYGGSSLLSYMLIIGILLNISQKKNRTYKYR